jgi:hypothetical protein
MVHDIYKVPFPRLNHQQFFARLNAYPVALYIPGMLALLNYFISSNPRRQARAQRLLRETDGCAADGRTPDKIGYCALQLSRVRLLH